MTSSGVGPVDRTSLSTKALLASASVEVSSRGHQIRTLRDGFVPGSMVTVTFLPGDDYRHNIETAVALRRLGYNPVPHIAARALQSRDVLGDFLARLRGEAGVTHILVTAGDMTMPRGPFASTLDVCRSGLIEGRGFDRVTIAGHPEGHPFLDGRDTFASIAACLEWAQAAGIALGMITQFCFKAAPIIDLLRALETHGLRLPVRVGLAGPAMPATLMRFALRCGIGNSIRAVHDTIGQFGRLRIDAGPDEVVSDIAASRGDATGLLEGFHIYPFGGLHKTGEWIQAALKAAGDEGGHG